MSLFNPDEVPSSSSSDEIGEPLIDATEPLSSSPAASPENTSQRPASSPSNSSSFSDAPDRPNKWRGSRQDLLKHYSDVRAIHNSLNLIEDDDLSAHLYNIHGLKRGIYPDILGVVPKKPVKQWMRKERLFESSGEWYPHRDWTSWPLEPASVPRGDERATWAKERQGDVEGARRDRERQLNLRPGHDLEEILLGEFTRQARKTFEAREWDVESHSEDEGRESAAPEAHGKKRSRTVEGLPSDSDTRRSGKVRKLMRYETASAMVSRSGTPLKHEMLEGPFEPVVLADDDEGREIAMPMVNHIMHSLDSLLHGLHKSRVHQVTAFKGRQRKAQEEGDEEYSDLEDGEDGKQTSESEADSTASETDTSRGLSTRRRKKRRPLRPRDWSEVLSMAAIVGWKPAIIQRAKARCEALFAESMDFHDLDKGPYDTLLADDSAKDSQDEMYGGVHIDGFLKPIQRKAEKQAYPLKIPRGGETSSDEGDEEEDDKCADCGTTSTTIWRTNPRDKKGRKNLCNACALYFRRYDRHRGKQRTKSESVPVRRPVSEAFREKYVERKRRGIRNGE